MNWIFVFLTAVIFYLIVVFLGNRWNSPAYGDLGLSGASQPKSAGRELSVTTWNIGYAALGARADFLIDGGNHLRVLSKPEIEGATRKIGNKLLEFDSNVILLQENAGASFLTRGVSVRRILNSALKDKGTCYWSDFSTRFVPRPLRINHGMSVYTGMVHNGCRAIALPQDPSYYYGFLKKYYGGVVTRVPIEGTDAEWVVINVHLSAFDESAAVRKKQLSALFALAGDEFSRGNHVVIGGDWNMKLSDAEFPHQTESKHLFWVFDFPMEMLPKGWSVAADHSVPTVRTLHQPFVSGENYTMIIDGFVVSPNVETLSVNTADLEFSITDHQPVQAKFSALATP